MNLADGGTHRRHTVSPASDSCVIAGERRELDERDASIASLLSDEIGQAVSVFHHGDGERSSKTPIAGAASTAPLPQPLGSEVFRRAKQTPSRLQSETAADGKTTVQAITLPGGGIAVWSAPTDQAGRIGRHAVTVLALQAQRRDNRQMLAEIESLTHQVMQDFEELSLIRSLVSSLALPQTAEDTDAYVLSSLKPLVGGVGAESIAAVLIEGGSGQKRQPLWTGPAVITDDAVHQLIDSAAAELCRQPLVRNRDANAFDCGITGLGEWVLVQCASEGKLHGWVLACNRIEDEATRVPWAQRGFSTVQASLMETATNQLASQLNNIRLLRQKEELFTDVIRALVNAVEARDSYTCGHSERVACFARLLASKTGFSKTECERVYLTGLLHDVGKIAIPDGVLQKPKRLNDEERAIIETHTDSGWRILHELDALQDVLPGVLYHHEQWNGQGYPDRLAGENIPIDGRILAVCDAFDAMTSNRPYRKGMSTERAMTILREGAGVHWDPTLVQTFERHIEAIEVIRRNHQPRRPATRPAAVDGKPVIGDPPVIEESDEPAGTAATPPANTASRADKNPLVAGAQA